MPQNVFSKLRKTVEVANTLSVRVPNANPKGNLYKPNWRAKVANHVLHKPHRHLHKLISIAVRYHLKLRTKRSPIVANTTKGLYAKLIEAAVDKKAFKPPKGTKNHPKSKMREYTPKEMDWEYHTEYEKYSKPSFPKAFKNRKHFQEEYDKAPLRHLSHEEMESLGNSHVGSVLHHDGDKKEKEQYVRDIIGHRRDVTRILNDLHKGKTAPPIILRHGKNKLHLMAGNTRLISGVAHGLNVPAKVIDVKR